MLVLAERADTEADALRVLGQALASGAALERFRVWIEAQGGDPRIAEDLSLLPCATCTREVRASSAGWVAHFDAEEVGRAAAAMGAGRQSVDDVIDPAAGLVLAVRVGARVETGDLLCTLHAASEQLLDAGEERFRRAVRMSQQPVTPPQLFHQL
jgi:pyrimidine-nucleoside phosphorylase